MPSTMLYLLAMYRQSDGAPLAVPVVVATITTDPTILGSIRPEKRLEAIAHQLGLTGWEIETGEHLHALGVQLNLPLGPLPMRRSRAR